MTIMYCDKDGFLQIMGCEEKKNGLCQFWVVTIMGYLNKIMCCEND